MSVGTAIFLIFVIIIAAAAAWYFLVRRPAKQNAEAAPANAIGQAPAPRATDSSFGAVSGRTPFVERYEPAPRFIDNRPVYVQPYVETYSPSNSLANLIVAEEIVEEVREERREERFEDMREERYEEPDHYEAPEQRYAEPAPYEAPDNNDGGGFGGGDDGSF